VLQPRRYSQEFQISSDDDLGDWDESYRQLDLID
jgi:hypothetical protein